MGTGKEQATLLGYEADWRDEGWRDGGMGCEGGVGEKERVMKGNSEYYVMSREASEKIKIKMCGSKVKKSKSKE